MNGTETLPRAHDAEKYILGCLIAFSDWADEVFELLTATDFVDLEHQKVFREAQRQHAAGGIDVVLLGRECGNVQLLVELALNPENTPTTPAHIASEAAKIIEARRKRQLHGIAESAVEGALNGQAADDVFRFLSADLDDYRRDTYSKAPEFPLITALELATAKFALNYLIERVLVDKQPCILGGPKKSLKTTIAVLIAICIAIGIDLFGKFRIDRPRRVLVCSAESGLATIKETAHRICRALGVSLEKIDNLIFTDAVPKPNNAGSLTAFRAALVESEAEVLILDPFYRMFDGDGQESIFKMGAVLGRIDDLCQELGVTLILCHHLKTGRLDQYAPAELDDLAYAGCAEYFRQWLLLSRREAYLPGSGEHRLWLTVGGSAGHNSLWALDINEGRADDPGGRTWDAKLLRHDEAREDTKRRKADAKSARDQEAIDEDRVKVVRLMVKHPAGASKTFIRDHCGVSSARFPKVFAEMFDAGELVLCQITVSNHKKSIPGYRLRKDSECEK